MTFCVASCVLLVAIGATAAQTAPSQARVTTSMQQGMHQWPAFKGKLVMIAGTEVDTLHYKRSLTFYYEHEAEWHHVPVVEGKNHFTQTLWTNGSGETTLADAVVVAQDKNIYLIKAALNSKKASITATTYQFVEVGDDVNPDGPWFLFKEMSNKSYPLAHSTVEEVLKKETARYPSKQKP